MAKIHVGATLTPSFREFLPPWVARQPWYRGEGVPALSMVGFFRFEDPAGEVGVETHLVSDGTSTYQIPMTYRGAPAEGVGEESLIVTTEHSVLGPRWIYDGPADPVWVDRVLTLVREEGVSEPSSRGDSRFAQARGVRVRPGASAGVEVVRVLSAGGVEPPPGVAGLVVGTWGSGVEGRLAVVRAG